MAYRSRGSSNDDMVDKLLRYGIIDSPQMEEAFRNVDRRLFMPQNEEGWACAYRDEPHRQEGIHLSAPHIYATALAALDLSSSRVGSFLNIGSGTGYFSAIASSWIGYYHQHYAIDIQEGVCQHARESLTRWKPNHNIQVLDGSAFDIDVSSGEGRFGMDRIYIGAAVGKDDIPQLASLLKKGGILVCPVEDELVKVVRVSSGSTSSVRSPPRSFGGHAPLLSNDFSVKIISAVRFIRLITDSGPLPVTLPSQVWSPSSFPNYPPSFRNSCRSLLMCGRAQTTQPPPTAQARQNNAALLPQFLWLEIFSYCHHDWFSSQNEHTSDHVWQGLLNQEREARREAEDRATRLEYQLEICRREKNVYQALVEHNQRTFRSNPESRLYELVLQRHGREDVEEMGDESIEEQDEEESNEGHDMEEDESVSSNDESTLLGSPTLTSRSMAGHRFVSMSEE